MRPPDRKRSAPPARGGASKIDSFVGPIERKKFNASSRHRQGKYSYYPLPRPVVVARQFGFLGALYVIYPDGSEQRLGLFENEQDGAVAARVVNKLFAMEVPDG